MTILLRIEDDGAYICEPGQTWRLLSTAELDEIVDSKAQPVGWVQGAVAMLGVVLFVLAIVGMAVS